MGGLISMYAAFEYPEIFDGAICMSTHWPGAYVIDNNPLPDAIFEYMSQNIPKSKGKTFYFDYGDQGLDCLLYTSPSPRDMRRSRMPSSA